MLALRLTKNATFTPPKPMPGDDKPADGVRDLMQQIRGRQLPPAQERKS